MTIKLRDGVMYATGFDDCLMGHATQATPQGVVEVAVYSVDKMLEKIASDAAATDAHNGAAVMEREYYLDEALEHFNFNIMSAFMGQNMVHPVFYREPVEGIDD